MKPALFLNPTKQRTILNQVTTNSIFALEPIQLIVNQLTVRTALIGGEVQNRGARHLSQKLPERITLRLGLSATPQRWMDEEGAGAVEGYLGSTVINFDLRDALSGPNAALCCYLYHPRNDQPQCQLLGVGDDGGSFSNLCKKQLGLEYRKRFRYVQRKRFAGESNNAAIKGIESNFKPSRHLL